MRKASRIASIVLLSFPLILLSFLSFLLTPLAATTVKPGEIGDLCVSRVFYGYAGTLGDGWGADKYRYLHVVGLEDDTTVSLYNITETPATLLNTTTVDRMGVIRWDGDLSVVPVYFKIVANKPVVAWVAAGDDVDRTPAQKWDAGRGYATFYPTVNDSFVGRDFIFEAYRGWQKNTAWGAGNASILAVEAATVNIYDATDTLLSTFTIAANRSKTYDFKTLTVYHVTSTGDIMIRQNPLEDRTMSPSTNGNFVGKMHFGSAGGSWGIWAIAYEPCYIEVYNITATSEKQLANHTFTKAGEYWNITGNTVNGSTHFYTVSTGLVSVGSGFLALPWGAIGYPGYIGGLYTAEGAEYWVLGSRTWNYGNVTIFAASHTEFTVNGTAYTLEADEHLDMFPPELEGVGSIWHVVSDKPLIINVLTGGAHWGSYLSHQALVGKPIASFTWSPEKPLWGETVTFDASASTPNGGDIVNYTWDFGDENITTVTDPIITHAYAAPATYTVTLTVTDDQSLTDTIQKTITAYGAPPPKASFTWSPEEPRVNETVTFDASASTPDGGDIVNYTWDFGDENITTVTDPIITHAYAAPATYTVTLTVADSENQIGTISKSIKVILFAKPVASFTWSPPEPLWGETVTFDASASTPDGGDIVNYTWDFGDENITTVTDPIITHIYEAAGNYTVTLTVTDDQSLTDTIQKTVTASRSLLEILEERVSRLEELVKNLTNTLNAKVAETLDELDAVEYALRPFSHIAYIGLALGVIAIILSIVERRKRLEQLERRAR